MKTSHAHFTVQWSQQDIPLVSPFTETRGAEWAAQLASCYREWRSSQATPPHIARYIHQLALLQTGSVPVGVRWCKSERDNWETAVNIMLQLCWGVPRCPSMLPFLHSSHPHRLLPSTCPHCHQPSPPYHALSSPSPTIFLHPTFHQNQNISECTAIPPHAAHHVVHKSAGMQFMQDHGMAREGESRVNALVCSYTLSASSTICLGNHETRPSPYMYVLPLRRLAQNATSAAMHYKAAYRAPVAFNRRHT